MDEPLSPQEAKLEAHTRDYVRAGWWVVARSATRVTLEKGQQTARLWLDENGEVQADGPALPMLIVDGRVRAWLVLLAIMGVVFGAAWVLGVFEL